MAKQKGGYKLFLFDGLKSVTLYGDEGWNINSGDESEDGVEKLFRAVPWMRRAVDILANSVSNIPFALVNSKGEDVDSSSDWGNTTGLLDNPRQLLWLIEASIVLCGKCYLLKKTNDAKYIKGVRFFNPESITAKLDPAKGLTGFTRRLGTETKDYVPDDLIYFWPPDPYVEIGPPKSSRAKAALAAAGVLNNVDEFMARFFKSGLIKSMIVGVPTGTPEPERQRLKEWLKNLLAGVGNAFGMGVFEADAIKPVIIGEGLEALKGEDTFSEGKKRDIAAAFNIPPAVMFSDAASYATAGVDAQAVIQSTIMPDCEFIAEVLNDQLFDAAGYHFEFRPETIKAFQEDEVNRADALVKITTAGMPFIMALDILGYDLNDEQRAELEAKEAEPEPTPPTLPAVVMPPGAPAVMPEPDANQQPPMTMQALNELAIWKRKAIKAVKAGDKPTFVFNIEAIPERVAEAIRATLRDAECVEDVLQAFDMQTKSPTAVDFAPLVAALNKAAKALVESE